MAETTALTFAQAYPPDKYNVLVPIQTVTEIADIQKPVMNVVSISTNLADREIYLQNKAYGDKPEEYALTRKGLLKLMRAAGIRIVSSRSVLPSTCQKCVEANRLIGRPANCGSCKNKDVKYTVVISAPQLTGSDIQYECSREINVEEEIAGQSPKQRAQFMKYRSEHCESKALNRALRAAMLIKPVYTLDELQKPFVVAFLAPNLDNPAVREQAVQSFFTGAKALYGSNAPAMQTQRIALPDDDDDYLPPADSYEILPDDAPPAYDDAPAMPAPQAEPEMIVCSQCNSPIVQSGTWEPQAIADYSMKRFGRVLCPGCQRAIKNAQNGGFTQVIAGQTSMGVRR